VAGDFRPQQGARSSEYPQRSLRDERRRCGPERSTTLRAEVGRAAGGVTPQSQSVVAMLLRRAWPAPRPTFSAILPIYEMGSKVRGEINSRKVKGG
jgi:hypothetical protein